MAGTGIAGIGEPADETYGYPTRHVRIIANAREAEPQSDITPCSCVSLLERGRIGEGPGS